MRMRARALIAVLMTAAFLAASSPGWWAWSQDGASADVHVRVLLCKPQRSRRIPLSPSTITYRTPAGAVARTAVVMERQDCQVRALIRVGDRRDIWEGRVLCYELRAEAGQVRWRHFVCLFPPAAHSQEDAWVWPGDEVHLFAPATGRKILAGSGSMAWIADVSAANTKRGEIEELLARAHDPAATPRPLASGALQGAEVPVGSTEIRIVPAAALIGEHRLSYASGPYRVHVEDIQLNEAGELVVVVTGSRDTQRYELVFDGRGWRRG